MHACKHDSSITCYQLYYFGWKDLDALTGTTATPLIYSHSMHVTYVQCVYELSVYYIRESLVKYNLRKVGEEEENNSRPNV